VRVSKTPQVGFGLAVRRRRREARLTCEDVAAAAGVSRSWLHNLEAGRANPTLELAHRIAGALGLPFHDLAWRAAVLETSVCGATANVPPASSSVRPANAPLRRASRVQ